MGTYFPVSGSVQSRRCDLQPEPTDTEIRKCEAMAEPLLDAQELSSSANAENAFRAYAMT